MKRWTNGLPGATMRLGAKMAQRGLSVSQPRMRADTHVGPELNAPLQRPDTLMQLSRSSFSEIRLVKRGRAIHIGTKRTSAFSLTMSAPEGENGHAFSAGTLPSLTQNGPRACFGLGAEIKILATGRLAQSELSRCVRGAMLTPRAGEASVAGNYQGCPLPNDQSSLLTKTMLIMMSSGRTPSLLVSSSAICR